MKPFAFVVYNSTTITGLICDECVTPLERERGDSNEDSGIVAMTEGEIVCSRCGNEASA